MHESREFVTLVIPCYNEGGYLRQILIDVIA